MAVTAFQSEVLKRIARSRIDGGETYVAGGLALNHLLKRPRVSSDVDVFNSTYSALERAADRDCEVLKAAGYDIRVTRRRDYIVEVVASRADGSTALQWVQDSAYRFFPLVEDELLGLTLHPFDLATNKIRVRVRREVISITSHDIAPNAQFIHMKTEWLEKILAYAQEIGLPVLGFDELPPTASL